MQAVVTEIAARAYTIPTDRPEADGTLAWDKTTIVIVFAKAGGNTGIGYSYASRATVALIDDLLSGAVKGKNAFDVAECWDSMCHAVRNLGLGSQVSAAIAAVDTALWDLKARLLDTSLVELFGAAAEIMPVYGSGGFTTYDCTAIQEQIVGWRENGIRMAKIKIGTHPEDDLGRVEAARHALGDEDQLFVDANGAYSAKQALDFAEAFRDFGVSWFEEPVISDDLEGLHRIRDRAPAGMDITAGEYGYDVLYMHRMLEAGAIDVLQIDATRCMGYTGFLRAAALANAANIPISSHCAPALHLPVCCHTHTRHMEYFHDHVRIEHMFFDGIPEVKNGELTPDLTAPGHGLVFKDRDAERYAA